MKTTVFLIRHGAYENPKNIFHGRLPGFPLSTKGNLAAYRMAKYLAHKPIVAVYSSRLTRAYQTAEIIAQQFHLLVTNDRRLLDIRTPLQGKPRSYVDTLDGSFYTEELIRAGGERLEDVYGRTDRCIRGLVEKYPGKHIVVVSHGDPIMSVALRYQGKPLPKNFTMNQWYVPQASGFQIEFHEDTNKIKVVRIPLP